MTFTKGTSLKEVLETQGAEDILSKHKVPCLGCAFAQYEMESLKLGDICKMYEIDLDSLLKDLNALSNKK